MFNSLKVCFIVPNIVRQKLINVGNLCVWAEQKSFVTFFTIMSHFDKVPAGHDTYVRSVIWKMADSKARGRMACQHPEVSVVAGRRGSGWRPLITWWVWRGLTFPVLFSETLDRWEVSTCGSSSFFFLKLSIFSHLLKSFYYGT